MINNINDETLIKMRQIVCFAYKHNPYYRKIYDEKEINPETVDLPYGLPIISHTELVKLPLLFRSSIPIYKVCASSGTINKPKLIFRTEEDFEKSVSNQIRLMQWSNVRPGDVVAIAQPFGMWGYGDLTQEATRRMGAMAIPIGNLSDETALELMITLKANILDISPSRLKSIIRLYQNRSIIGELQLKSIMCAGEQVTCGFKKYVLDTLNAQVYDQYGSEETDGLGGNNGYNKGIALFNDDFIFEVLNDQGLPVKESEAGTLVITSLYHKGTPLIRYELQDIIKQCRNNPLEVEVLGRKCDYAIIHDSVKLYPYQIEQILKDEVNDIMGWQCIIEQIDNKIQVIVKIDSQNTKQSSLNRIELLLPKSSIDIQSLVQGGNLVFKVEICTDTMIYTNRDKCLKIIDMRFE